MHVKRDQKGLNLKKLCNFGQPFRLEGITEQEGTLLIEKVTLSDRYSFQCYFTSSGIAYNATIMFKNNITDVVHLEPTFYYEAMKGKGQSCNPFKHKNKVYKRKAEVES